MSTSPPTSSGQSSPATPIKSGFSSASSSRTASPNKSGASKGRMPPDGHAVPIGSRIMYHCGTDECATRTSLHLLVFNPKSMKPLCSNPTCVKYVLKTFYCPHSLLPSTDALQNDNKNRSAGQIGCPRCFTTLVQKAGFLTTSEDGGEPVRSNDFYLACPFCCWTSLPDLHDISTNMLLETAIERERLEELESRLHDCIDRCTESHEQWSRGAASRVAAGSVGAAANPATGGRTSNKQTHAVLARIRSLANVRNPGSPKIFDSPREALLRASSVSSMGERRKGGKTWQDLEDELRSNTMSHAQEQLNVPLVPEDATPQEVSLADDLAHGVDDFASMTQTFEHCMNNGKGTECVGQPVSNLRPLRLPLRVKKNIRCPKTSSILVRPNVNPQQGDSNFTNNQSSNWFQMSKFASEYIPRMVLHRVTSKDIPGGTGSVLVEAVIEIRKPRCSARDEDKLTMTITARPEVGSKIELQVPPKPLLLTKTDGTTKDQTAATTAAENKPFVISCADGAALIRLRAIAPGVGPLKYPLKVQVKYPVKYEDRNEFEFSYNVDIETVAP